MFYDNKLLIEKDNEVVAVGMYEPEHGLFRLPIIKEIENSDVDIFDNVLSYYTCTYNMWHQRLGHSGIN